MPPRLEPQVARANTSRSRVEVGETKSRGRATRKSCGRGLAVVAIVAMATLYEAFWTPCIALAGQSGANTSITESPIANASNKMAFTQSSGTQMTNASLTENPQVKTTKTTTRNSSPPTSSPVFSPRLKQPAASRVGETQMLVEEAHFVTVGGSTVVGGVDSRRADEATKKPSNVGSSSQEIASEIVANRRHQMRGETSSAPSFKVAPLKSSGQRVGGWQSVSNESGQRRFAAASQQQEAAESERPSQLEKPSGYSYNSEMTGYTHVSPISQPEREPAEQLRRHQQASVRTAHFYSGATSNPRAAQNEQTPLSSGSRVSAAQSPQFGQAELQQTRLPGYTGAAASIPCRPPSQELVQSELSATSSVATLMPARYLRAGDGTRLRSQFVFKVLRADSLTDCEFACSRAALAGNNAADTCRSFNYRAHFAAENCELSRHDLRSLRLEDSAQFEQHTQFDFYALEAQSAPLLATSLTDNDCLDVSQSCTPDGMEFALRTTEPFRGRIYTYGFHESCFSEGDGSASSVLRISRAGGFPRCGTQQIGDLMTNIVVVQFNERVQTSRDRKYNLTCYFSGPAEAVVTSSYLDTKLDERSHPLQIEHLPPQNVVTSNVHLRVLYRGQPTNTIAVGDLLTFRLETRGRQRAESSAEIFATNVIAKDPYSGHQVQLVDSRGCPLDAGVFPELQRTPDGALESEFYAFKIPDANFLIFQATVRTCKAPCEPVICAAEHPRQYLQSSGGGIKGGAYSLAPSASASVPSWGRRRRSADTGEEEQEQWLRAGESVEHVIPARFGGQPAGATREVLTLHRPELAEAEEEVKEMFRVFLSRAEINRRVASERTSASGGASGPAARLANAPELLSSQQLEPSEQICLAPSAYQVMLFAVISTSLLMVAALFVGLYVSRAAKFRVSPSLADAIF